MMKTLEADAFTEGVHDWEIIVEPDVERELLVVGTAYPVWK